jgi:hypothetical protein
MTEKKHEPKDMYDFHSWVTNNQFATAMTIKERDKKPGGAQKSLVL